MKRACPILAALVLLVPAVSHAVDGTLPTGQAVRPAVDPAPADGVRDIPAEVFRASQPREVVEATRAAAIERSVREVSWFFRGYARHRLSKVATACPAYQLVVDAPRFEVICDGKTVFHWRLGQTGTWTTETGDVVHVTLTEQPSAFVLRFDTDADGGSGKQFTYAWDQAGGLVVSQQIFSPHLPVPVAYSLHYRAP